MKGQGTSIRRGWLMTVTDRIQSKHETMMSWELGAGSWEVYRAVRRWTQGRALYKGQAVNE